MHPKENKASDLGVEAQSLIVSKPSDLGRVIQSPKASNFSAYRNQIIYVFYLLQKRARLVNIDRHLPLGGLGLIKDSESILLEDNLSFFTGPV